MGKCAKAWLSLISRPISSVENLYWPAAHISLAWYLSEDHGYVATGSAPINVYLYSTAQTWF